MTKLPQYLLQIDNMVGSNSLFTPLYKLSGGKAVRANLVQLGADVAWTGRGPNGSLVRVGLEYKQLADYVDCIYTNRLPGWQMPLMAENYDICYILVEGIWKRDKEGFVSYQYSDKGHWRQLMRGKAGAVPYNFISKFSKSVLHQAEFDLITCADTDTTINEIYETWSWWQKPWESHDSMHGIYEPAIAPRKGLGPVSFRKPNFVAKFARAIPGVGDIICHRAGAKFRTVQEMVNANEGTWSGLDGVGPELARRIPQLLQQDGRVD